ncbi:ACT domain-containing protein [Ligilactobacillus agilis]|uniref:ACT domain-containing protein n=1 Tax=Ligilactobacillus agilis TaxID=1601 RepID=UPI0022E80A93|nr:ACT domain-containing protein [Ligilactobacillus agilis]
MKAILTTVGQDQVGIIAGVSNYLAQKQINILDVSQTIMSGYFTMMMMVEVPSGDLDFVQVATELKDLGTKLGVEINIRNADLYQAMHQL